MPGRPLPIGARHAEKEPPVRTRRSPALFACSFLYVLSAASSAAEAATLTGRILDPDGRPVAQARVLVSGAGVPLQAATTDSGGGFALEVPDTGTLTLRVAAEGFRVEPRVIELTAEPRDLGAIALAVSALTESIVVSAAQVELPLTHAASSVTVITGAELESRQLHTVADALRMVPGLNVVRTGGIGTTTSVFPRGGESNYTLVLIDGVPVNVFGGDFDFEQVPATNLERIEIVRGSQSALFGANAIGAVVRIVTRRGGRPAAQLLAEAGGFATSRVSASTSGGRGELEWGASFDQLLSDGMNGRRTPAGEQIVNDDYERRSGAVSGGWRRGGATVRADLRHSADDRGFPGPFGSNPIGIYSGIDGVSRGDNRRTAAALSAAASLSPRLRLQAQASYSRLASHFASGFGDSDASSRRGGGRVQADVALAEGFDVSAGLELQRERASSTFITGSVGQEIPIARTTAGYFGEARWQSRERLFVTAGLRIEDIRRDAVEASPDAFSPRPALAADTVVSVNPRLAVAWIARAGGTAYTKLRGSVGTGIRPPDGFELAFTDNPGLRPERNLSAEAGVDQALASGLVVLEATGFVNDYDDLIVAVGSFQGSSRYRTDNIANARSRGVELGVSVRGRIPGRAIDLGGRIGYTLLDTEVLAVDRDDQAPPPFEVGQPLLRRPRHQLVADFSVAAARLQAFLRGGGRGTALDVEPSSGTFGGLFDAAGYQVWHAGVSWRLVRAVEIFGRVENLFDRSYEEALGFPALGRRAFAGLRIAAGR